MFVSKEGTGKGVWRGQRPGVDDRSGLPSEKDEQRTSAQTYIRPFRADPPFLYPHTGSTSVPRPPVHFTCLVTR